MKKIKYIIFFLMISLLGTTSVLAASFKVSANKGIVVVGSSVNVTVSVSGEDADGWEYCLNYDSSKYKLTSHSSPCILGSIMAGNKTVTFKLKAIASGTSSVTLKDASILDSTAKEVLNNKGAVKLTNKTQAEIEASYSTNANLKSLSVEGYEISPGFDKDTLNYTLEVENEVEKVTIKAGRADSGATVSGTGEKELTEGTNKFEIVVTAEKGNKKTYVLEINRKELNPINVNVDGKTFTIVRKADVLTAPAYYASSEVEIENEMVPVFKSDITGYVLVGLKDEDGSINLYRYDDNNYSLYKQLGVEGLTIIPVDTTELIDGFNNEKEITINNSSVKVYTGENESDFVLVYGMNASNGEKNWYKFDTEDNTFQRYEVNKDDKVVGNNDIYFILTVVFASLSLVTILLVIVLISMNSKLRKKNNKLISMVESSINKVKEDQSKEELQTKEVQKEIKEVVEKSENNEKDLEEDGLSKREQRRLEKEKEAKQHEELRKMQEDFLKTEANEIIVDDVELEESAPVRKKGKRKAK